MDFDYKSPKKQRHEGRGEVPAATAGVQITSDSPPTAAAVPQPQWAAPLEQHTPGAGQQPQEAGGSNDEALHASLHPAGEPAVTDAAKAFRELRVRPALSGVERVARAGSPARGAGAAERPPSPKKRKASYNIDKEFILKDDKVKRNTDTQGDISQARGQLGQLLFEFSQIELNRDLLEAIKRTESKTGRTTGSRSSGPGRLNRAAFELAVADAEDLLQSQLSTVEAHSKDAALRSAILRTYAVQAIATFADDDWESEEEESGSAGSDSSDDENNDSNGRRVRRGSSSGEGAHPAASCDAGSQQSRDLVPPPRPASALGCHSPPPASAGEGGRGGAGKPAPSLRADGEGPHSMPVSPQRAHAAASAAEQASSSFLPDAPSDAALEDTATAALREAAAQPEAAAAGAAGRVEGQARAGRGDAAAADDGHMQARMRMLSLEAEGSAHQQQASSGVEGEGEEGPQDMVRSPAPVTSRRTPLPLPPPIEGEEAEGEATQAAAAASGEGQAAGGIQPHATSAAHKPSEHARRLAFGGRTHQRRQAQQPPQPQPPAQQGQEGSEGRSGGRASSAAAEPPKRQRRSGDQLPPLQEPALESAAAQRAAILGSLQPRAAGEAAQPQQQQQQQQQQHGDLPQPAPAAPEAGPQGSQSPQQQPGDPAREEAAAPGGLASDAALRAGQLRAAHSGSSVWGSTLVCADLTLNDVASQYWPFLRSAMQGQAVSLAACDQELVASLVRMLGDTITDAYASQAGAGCRPAAEVKSLVAATAFDDFFRAKHAAESSGASL